MKTPAEADLVGLIAFIIAGLCAVAVIVLGLRHRRRTGELPAEMRPQPGSWGWFGLVLFLWMFGVRLTIPADYVRKFPLFAIVPGIDLGLVVAFLVFAGFVMSYALGAVWNWRTGMWMSRALILPAMGAYLLYMDVRCLQSMQWAWISAAIVGIMLAPFLTRLVFVEFYLSTFARESELAEPSRPRIYRPGEP